MGRVLEMLKDILKYTVKTVITVICLILIVILAVIIYGTVDSEPDNMTFDISTDNSFFAGNNFDGTNFQSVSLSFQYLTREQQMQNRDKMINLFVEIVSSEQARIQEKYRRMIIIKEDELNRELQQYIAAKEAEFARELETQKKIIEELVADYLEEIKQSELAVLGQYERQLSTEYFQEKFNVHLQLSIRELSPSQKKDFESRLHEIESEIQQKLAAKEAGILELVAGKVAQQRHEYEKKLQDYQKELVQIKQKQIINKKTEINDKLAEYQEEQETAKLKEIAVRKQELENRIIKSLGYQEKIIELINENYEKMWLQQFLPEKWGKISKD